MGITANSGPHISYGTVLTSTAGTGLSGNVTEYNEERAPDLSDLGYSLMDPREAYQFQPGQAVGSTYGPKTWGFYYGRGYVDYVPSSASSNSFTASSAAAPSGGAALTLRAASSTYGTYSCTIIAPETGKTSETLLAIDSTAAYLTFGSAGSVAMWNPGAGTGRCIAVTASSTGDLGGWLIAGRDMYGFKMSETLLSSAGTTGTSGITATTQKAFKYISTILAATTITSTGVGIGLSDNYGMPLYVPYVGHDLTIRINSTLVISGAAVTLSSSTFTAGLLSSIAAVSTSADSRGIYQSTTASNGVVRLQISVTPAASAVAAVNSTNFTPLFGANQYST